MIPISAPASLEELKKVIDREPLAKQVYALVSQRFSKDRATDHPTDDHVDPGHDLSHFLRVAFWTLKIAAELPEPVNACEAIAAALLHDIVPVPKNSTLRAEASRLCAEEAARVLPRLGFSAASVENIAEAVRCHSFSRGEVAKTPLAKSLQDADRLEALGTIGIMRCISTGARMGTEYFDSQDPWAESRALDDRAYSIDHFFTKLLQLPATMTTEPGRREAKKRTEIIERFLKSLGEEIARPISATRLP